MRSPTALRKKNRGGGTTKDKPSSAYDNNDHRSQPPPEKDVELAETNIGGSGNSDRFVSQKEKSDFNARLEERRRLRRDQRTRRNEREDLHRSALGGSGGKRSAYARSRTRSLMGFCFCTILSFWLGIFLYLASQTEFHNSGVISPLQLRNRGEFLKHLTDNIKDAIHDIPNRIKRRKKLIHNIFEMDKPSSANDVVDNGDSANLLQANANLLQANPNEVIDMRILNKELPFTDKDGGAWKQGWDVTPIKLTKDKPLRVFILPHSHCDPGWIKTFDDYFQSQTKQILSAVFDSLLKDPRRKFIWAEISYFEWWWREQSQNTKNDVRKLLDNKQFEFVTGGWVQPDEANTQLYAMEIQLEEGHDFIRQTFGEKYIPKYGWSIDPFGYSPTMAYLLKKHHFKGMLIQRVHYAIKKELALHKNLEFMWRQTWDTSPNGDYDIFTHLMPFYSYDVPHTCGPDPAVCCQFDFARVRGKVRYVDECPWARRGSNNAVLVDDTNLKERAMLILDQYKKKANLYQTNVVLAPLGDDFRYRTVEEADLQYENHQKIHDYINANVDNVEISFGTLSEYFEYVMNERPFAPPVLKGSFFTYADREQDYWSGYFTSRVFDKALDRQLERTLYAATTLGANKTALQGPRRALSLFQHHDGVTGTAASNVVLDYAKRIHKAIKETQHYILQHMISNDIDHGHSLQLAKEMRVMACWQSTSPRGLSKNLCDHGEGTKVIVYNPMEKDQSCGRVVVPALKFAHAKLPCEIPGPLLDASKQKLAGIEFDPNTGLMVRPIREEWMVWRVKKGGAYLFFPGELEEYDELGLDIQDGGVTVSTNNWKRTVIERKLNKDDYSDGKSGIAIDFVFETNLQSSNEEWFVRFTNPDIQNQGVFHTDLNGFNFDTHNFRSDMPIQSQVFPMPTLASIEDSNNRMTVLSEHAQGTASLEESTIDIWLDRRLNQDDARGLGQGVTDNVPTRTRLRVILEETPEDGRHTGEFSITPFCKHQWKALNHPLEMFGSGAAKRDDDGVGSLGIDAINLDNRSIEDKTRQHKFVSEGLGKHEIVAVYMVNNRADYLKQAIETLLESDYPKSYPVIISHDSHNPEVLEYVESIKKHITVIQLFHPFSCADHPDSFPGEDPKLNEDYAGDTYGNKRDGKLTCCKHHFSWMINEVFNTRKVTKAEGFIFLEEDYIVAPTVFETIQKGFDYIDKSGRQSEFFGVALDPSDAYSYRVTSNMKWLERKFVTGPMVIRRDMFEELQDHARYFCMFDDNNWDWSIVHMMEIGMLPERVLVPGQVQAAHIGIEGGMHEKDTQLEKKMQFMSEIVVHGKLTRFFADVGTPKVQRISAPSVKEKGFGGWGHQADQNHCIEVFHNPKFLFSF